MLRTYLTKIYSSLNPYDDQKTRFNVSLLFIFAAIVLFYLPVLKNEFVNWDDSLVIVQNPHIRSIQWGSIQWMFTTFHNGHWMPLTWFSFTLNYVMLGPSPIAFHFTNVLLHALNAMLVFLVTVRLLHLADIKHPNVEKMGCGYFAVSCALLTAIVFGVHPLRVESVAWATERKDVLYAFFYLLGVFIYLGRSRTQRRDSKRLAFCFALFLCAVMSKSMAMTFPAVLLLLDVWPLRRFSKTSLVEKILFFIVTLFAGIMAVIASKVGAFSTVNDVNVYYRLINPIFAIAFYIWKTWFPFNLSPIYPFSHDFDGLFYARNALALLMFLFVTWFCVKERIRRPYCGIAWMFYVVTLLPVLGMFQVGNQAAADRYTYLAGLGVILPCAVVFTLALSNRRFWMTLSVLIISIGLGCGTVKQISVWSTSQTLWEQVVRIYPYQSSFAHGNLGATYQAAGRNQEAFREFKRSIAINPPRAMSYNGLGVLLFQMGKNEEAIQYFKYANTLEPQYLSPHLNLWRGYEQMGMKKEALAEMLEIVRLEPNVPDYYFKLGLSYKVLQDISNARAAFEKAGAMDPANPQYQGKIMKLLTEKTPN